MLAYAGFIAQHITTGTTPLANLSAHLADPWGAQHIHIRAQNSHAQHSGVQTSGVLLSAVLHAYRDVPSVHISLIETCQRASVECVR